MENNTNATVASSSGGAYKVHGTVRGVAGQTLSGITIKAFNKSLRSKKKLNETITENDGTFTITYSLKNPGTAALQLEAYDRENRLLKVSGIIYKLTGDLHVDFELDLAPPANAVTGYEQLITELTPFTADIPMVKLMETTYLNDISFIIKKTGISYEIIGQMAMAALFESYAPSIPSPVWFGILSQITVNSINLDPPANSFDLVANMTFDSLMHSPVNLLIAALQKAITAGLITAVDINKTTQALNALQLDYAAKHPVTGTPSALYQKALLAGLSISEAYDFISLKNNHTGDENELFDKIRQNPALNKGKKAEAVQAVLKVAHLTGDNPVITEALVKNHKIKTVDDVKQLAAYSRKDWIALLEKNETALAGMVQNKVGKKDLKRVAAHLETTFTKTYPTETVAARLLKDTQSKLPHKDKVAKFLHDNQQFNLLTDHVGTFIKNNKISVAQKDAADVAGQVRRIQRVLKLTSSYDDAAVLLNSGIHSAQQVYKMGQDNFVSSYSDTLGANNVQQIYQAAEAVHTTAIALTSNLKAMADASNVKSFSNFGAAITQQLSDNLPNMDTLFGHNNYCECSDCRSVYGAPAYLTDLLHYLDKRSGTLPAPTASDRIPSVKDILLRRRSDIGNIDLGCDNSNTAIPYIDIACELMEDYISPPVISLPSAALVQFTKGTINNTLLVAITSAFTTAVRPEIGNLLTAAAVVSDPYTVKHLQADNTYITQTHWIIRDTQLVLRASQTTATSTIEVQLVHQTLLPADAISAGPEYVNNKVYTDFLKLAKSPFTLPFDLFETEGQLYLEKLGVKKADLIDIFRKEDKAAPGTSFTDYRMACTILNINEAEQTLIFTADIANQNLYWGTLATASSIQIDVFEKATGLSYNEILELVTLQFVNPAKDTLIEHDAPTTDPGNQWDSISADITKQRITNLTTTKLDSIHRFLRLWRKTSFTMAELDAIIMAPVIGTGKITSKLALQIYQFNALQVQLQLGVFQLLAFYQNIDTSHNLPNCLYNQLFQNTAITNPVSVNFTIAAATAGTITIADADKAVIAAVLQISQADVALLLPKTSGKITFATLSALYRFAQLAQSLKLSITDVLTVTNLIDANPFQDLQAATLFMQKHGLLQSSGFSIDELNYLLRHQDNSAHTLVPASSQIATALTQLQNELLAVRAGTQVVADAMGSQLSQWLSDAILNWDPSLLNRVLDIINTKDNTDYQQKIDNNINLLLNLRMAYNAPYNLADLAALPLTSAASPTPIIFPANISQQLIYDADKKQLKLIGYMNATDKANLLALSKDLGYQAAINSLYTKAQLTDSSATNILFANAAEVNSGLRALLDGKITDRYALMLNKLSPVYRKQQQQAVLIKDISTWFTTDRSIVTQLLACLPVIYTEFTDDNFVGKTTSTNVTQTNRYLFLAKLALIVSRLRLTAADLAFLLPHAADIKALDFTTLPVAAVTTPATSFPAFEILVNLLKLVKHYPAKIVNGADLSIYSIMADAISKGVLTGTDLTNYTNTLIANLSLLTGWNAGDLNLLIGVSNYITLSLPSDIKSVPIIYRLHRRFITMQQLGISVIDGFAWSKSTLLPADTAKIKQSLKLKYTSSDWQQITVPLQNILREKKRDALIAYLLANPGTQTWKDETDLFAYFLIDVEMCSCQPTTRVVQATNSVQLFVQRCYLQLENNVQIDSKLDSTWLQWEWMKNFRVWQANAKVFLYPENYIEPELLPQEIKSPFLTDLENDLLQGEVNAGNVDIAFENYLNKLRDVSRLEVKNQWYDDASQTLHVVGRTYGGDPKIYYHRKFIAGRRWTPWEKIDLDIDSEFVMPVVYNSHLYLFWALIKSITDASGKKQWRIQLVYSEYRNGKWSPKKTSENNEAGAIICDQATYPDITRFMFTPIDIPIIDYDWLTAYIRTPTPPFWTTIKNAALLPGSLIINCFYYHKDAPYQKFYPYISSFQLDIAKGYPVRVDVTLNIYVELRTWVKADPAVTVNNPPIQKNFVNMYEAELNPPIGTGWPSTTNSILPDQSRGAYKKTIPLQMGASDRGRFLYDTSFILTALGGFGDFHPSNLIPYFYQDKHRTYFIIPEITNNADFEYRYENDLRYMISFFDDSQHLPNDGYYLEATHKASAADVNYRERYFNFYYTNNDYFMQRLFTSGIDGLMSRDTQLKGDRVYDTSADKFSFATYYKDLLLDANQVDLKKIYTGSGNTALPVEDVDFNLQSGYGAYNWELFYHAPLMIAERLSQNQQFDDADRWYKYIFNPTDTSSNPAPQKFWNTKPFFETAGQDYMAERIDNILKGINTGTTADLIQDVTDWRNNPFQPHYIAQYRTVAYQKVAVMKYIGHLIRYGDYLFAQDTMESVNQATQLYLLASEILGPKPQAIPSPGKTAVDNYYQLEQKLDAMSDAMVNVENLLPFQSVKGYTGTTPPQGAPSLQTLYYCIPANENMTGPTGYWDIITDRLYKIRHCMNIDGTVAPLSIFAPPINPALLVRAAAAGIDIGNVLNDMNAPLPTYRFMSMVQKATELVNEVKSLGGLLLSALEKRDAESVSLLRSGQEIRVQNATMLIKQKQIDDSQNMLNNVLKQKELTLNRKNYYNNLITGGLSGWEVAGLVLNGGSLLLDTMIAVSYFSGSVSANAPTQTTAVIAGGTASGTIAGTAAGGPNVAQSAENMARNVSALANGLDKAAALTNTTAAYKRRADEWGFQLDMANKELEQLDVQIAGAQLRITMANQDAINQQLMIDNAIDMDSLMHSKYTNADLYNWMITQVSTTYFKTYQLAYDVAKRAEHCFRYELGLGDSAYINFGYWDNLKKGLLAGEQLSYDLKNMEMAYYDQNKRELELTKPISLSQLDPVALLKLKTTGECWINLPEELFDMDYPGHYMRRVKSVSITIPCITGPYTTVSCKLTMTNNSVRTSALSAGDASQYPRKTNNGMSIDDPRFKDAVGTVQSIATSSAQNDSGLFELNFRDERYLPFEGAGAISMWHLELPSFKTIQQFNFDSISDVIIHLKYTARDGGDTLKASAATSLSTRINQMLVSTKDTGLMRTFSAKNDLATEWYRFLNPVNATDDQVLTVNLDKTRFPLFVQNKTIKIRSIELIADATAAPINGLLVTPLPNAPAAINLTATGIYGTMLSIVMDYNNDPGTWTIKNPVANARLTESVLRNLIIIIHYVVS